MIASTGNSVDLSMTEDGKGGWLGGFFFFLWMVLSGKLGG
jgi:hypothetical protein